MNTFQIALTKRILDVVWPNTLGDVVIEINKPPDEVTVAIRLPAKNVVFWIYEDGAEILGPKVDDRFEIEDYRSLAELEDAFFRRATSYASG